MSDRGERIYRRLLRIYPRAFRERYQDDLVAFFRQDREHAKYGAGMLRPLRFWSATVADLFRAAARARVGANRPPYPPVQLSRNQFGSHLRHDLRDAWRSLRAAPGLTISVLGILTLGIGASAAIYSVVDAVALRGLPFDESNRLVDIAETNLTFGGRPGAMAPQNYFEFLARQHSFDQIGAWSNAGQASTVDVPDERLHIVRLTAPLFDVLRVSPAMGRRFTAPDERPGSPVVALLSDRLWRSRFQGSPDVIGQRLRFEQGAFEIIGVMPPDFIFPIGSIAVSNVDLWASFVPTIRDTAREQVGRSYSLNVIGRLRAGMELKQAAADIQRIHDDLAPQFPRWFKDRGVSVRPLQEAIVGKSVRGWMLLLLGAVGCVLLMACLNVASLLLAQAVARGREVAVRAALGARPWDLARALIVESLTLSVIGSALGVLLAFWGVRILQFALPRDLPRLGTVAVDVRVLIAAAVAAVVTGLLFGTLPAFQTSRPDVSRTLRFGGRAETGAGGARRLRLSLVVAEVAIAVVLLAGSGLFLSSFLRVVNTDLGFDPDGVVTMTVAPQLPRGLSAEARVATSHPQVLRALERVQSLPGVVAAAAVGGGLPMEGSYVTVPVQVSGSETRFTDKDEMYVHSVTPEYLDVMRSALVRGRWLAASDTVGAPLVVVLSDEAATRYFGGADPLGRILVMDKTPRTVVGILRGSRFRGPERDAPPEAYVPFVQGDQPIPDIVVRAGPNIADVAARVRAAILEELPGGFVATPETLDSYFATIVAQRKFNMVVLVVFGVLAVLIAAAGIYGLLAFLVSQQTRELGIRLALGAAPLRLLKMVLTRAVALVAIGLAAGLSIAAGLQRAIDAFLFQSGSYRLAVYAAVALLLVVIGLLAAFVPARRAARTDPLVTLKAE